MLLHQRNLGLSGWGGLCLHYSLDVSAISWSMILNASSRGRLGTKCRVCCCKGPVQHRPCFLVGQDPQAHCILCLLSTVNGVVTTATTRAPALFASSATIGAIPVPVATETGSYEHKVNPMDYLANASLQPRPRLPITGSPLPSPW